MSTGAYLSGLAHIGLVLWALLGGILFRTPPPASVSTSEVTLLTPEEFAAIVSRPEPESVQDVAALEPPSAVDAPAVPVPSTPVPRPDTPEIAGPSEAEDVPEQPDLSIPVAEVEDTAPELSNPDAPDETIALLAPVPQPDAPRAAPRIAPTPAPAPPPLAERAPDLAPGVTETPEAPPEPVEDQAPAAPPEAATEIVTEAEEDGTATAPRATTRPRSRPARQRVAEVEQEDSAPEEKTEVEPETPPRTSAIAEALAAAAAAAPASPRPAGPPLTSGEKDGLRIAVQRCWNVGSLSSEALSTTVTVVVSMLPDGRPDTGSIRMLSSDGGGAATNQAYEAARRAIIRCGLNGYDLPRDKYDQWREIEMSFNPERMRIK